MSNAAQASPLSVQEVVRAAVHALPSFLYGGQHALHVRVEEVFRPSRTDDFWRITLSHLEPGVPKPKNPVLGRIIELPPEPERVYHVLDVHPETGEVLAMRIREPRT